MRGENGKMPRWAFSTGDRTAIFRRKQYLNLRFGEDGERAYRRSLGRRSFCLDAIIDPHSRRNAFRWRKMWLFGAFAPPPGGLTPILHIWRRDADCRRPARGRHVFVRPLRRNERETADRVAADDRRRRGLARDESLAASSFLDTWLRVDYVGEDHRRSAETSSSSTTLV